MLLQLDNPEALWGLIAVGAMICLMIWKGTRHPASFSLRRLVLISTTLSLCILGLARPQLGNQQTKRAGMRSNLFIAVDVSRSMAAADITPTRLGFATVFASRVIDEVAGSKIAIFPFAMDGYMMTPLTNDTTVAREMLAALGPSVTTAQGTDLTRSLETLLAHIQRMETLAKERGEDWSPCQVLLLSDGETHNPLSDDTVRKFRSRRIPIFSVGTGTVSGAQVPGDSRFGQFREWLRDKNGRPVLSRLNPDGLQRMATGSGGEYFPPHLDESKRLSQRLMQNMHFEKVSTAFKVDKEYFPLLFALALTLFALEFLFGRWEYAIRAFTIFFLLSSGTVAFAQDDERRAVDAYNEALTAVNQGNLQQSTELFSESASLAKDPKVKKQALFNLGNSLLKSGDPIQALVAYQLAHDSNTGSRKFDEDANKRISENIVLATRLEQERRAQQKQDEGKEGKEGDQEKQQPQDPNGPKKDYKAEFFNDSQKQRMFDLIAGEEQQILQKLMEAKNRKAETRPNDKPW